MSFYPGQKRNGGVSRQGRQEAQGQGWWEVEVSEREGDAGRLCQVRSV